MSVSVLAGLTAVKYSSGNEIIDKYMTVYGHDELWLVQGPKGRKVVFATSAEQAMDYYDKRWSSQT